MKNLYSEISLAKHPELRKICGGNGTDSKRLISNSQLKRVIYLYQRYNYFLLKEEEIQISK